jgi:SseB protein C-terminal domain
MDIIEPRFLDFLGEQDGELERELKQKIVLILEESREIKSAYLAIADYRDGSSPSVVLCLRSEKGDDPTLGLRIGKVFAELFNAKEHLDVLFMNSRKESAVRAVCSPFYVRGILHRLFWGLYSISREWGRW